MRVLSIASFCLLTLAVAPNARADAELDKFQGTWKADKASFGGQDAPKEAVDKMVFTFKDDMAIPKDNPKDIATIKVDGAKKPSEIDFTDKDKKVNKGIYRFVDKDTIEFCINLKEDSDRPKDFTSPKDSMHVVMVMKREKEKEKDKEKTK